MTWLLDTNVWIHHLKNPNGPVEQRLNGVAPSEILLCSVVKAELWHGAHTVAAEALRLAGES
ncbi:MAG: type II toxin-antitoxin system VapC family toxin [Verrucomicrobia bacterium]|nr:type II toxin-antitoxin system VapC family toxin [Verrucomicrobiota bacterium]